MNKKIGIALGVIVIILIVVFFATRKSQSEPTSLPVVPLTASSAASIPANNIVGTSYTLTQISGHSNASSCWSAINGKVYDLTSWIDQHPGGQEAILSMCGKDSSTAYNDQHGGQKRPANELTGFYIGTLAN
ncbi:MAG: cytochrome b5-like heme/steroid binding domain-containing protein [Candidatus Taylorbacteria bacterium]|nr:cytochrome b5-like heme/steroid binding domain-containing protein [Candidatus Taylorbacteria bacterium]